jgi:hypothetical protein
MLFSCQMAYKQRLSEKIAITNWAVVNVHLSSNVIYKFHLKKQ